MAVYRLSIPSSVLAQVTVRSARVPCTQTQSLRLLFCCGMTCDFGQQPQPPASLLFDLLATEKQRKVFAFGPQRQEIAVMRALRLTRLTRDVDRNRVVPICKVEDFTKGRATPLNEPRAAGRVDGVGVAAARNCFHVEYGAP